MLDNRIRSIYPCHILGMLITTHDMSCDKLTVLTTADFDLLVPMTVWKPQFHSLCELIEVGCTVVIVMSEVEWQTC
jgi:hypothetical protein